ncbi:uncharacterized protein LOC124164220 [Ischnura elegans]|uniref:uncharacterized protein LOC124164220 n=1 Tax=Ischnura elegans TaxID=197161 RepID=UPI001ED88813|nr:uncharacterized protein LOC124164220 [Ischnura elegans]
MLRYRMQEDVDQLMKKFWEIEEVTSSNLSTLSDEERTCKDHSRRNVRRDERGRYVVRLPLQHSLTTFGNTKRHAEDLFHKLEKRFEKDKKLKQNYSIRRNEYLELDLLEPCSNQICSDLIPANYLPHHPVFKDSSTTTKLRVVFDGSAKSTSGIAFNDSLVIGPNMQRDLFSILVSFRFHSYVFTADIKQMYRQIRLHPADTNLQCILWRNSPEEALLAYRLTTVTFGLACSPFLATRCLLNLAETEKLRYPLAAAVTMKDFYVDDLITGASTIEGALRLQSELVRMLSQAGFHLLKWCANHLKLLQYIARKDQEVKYDIKEDSRAPLVNSYIAIAGDVHLFDRFSSLYKLRKVISYCRRFITNAWQLLQERNFGLITAQEIKYAMSCLIKIAQGQHFSKEVEDLKAYKCVSGKSKLRPLCPFLDESCVIRVGGRLKNSQLSYGCMHPIILPDNSNLTSLIFVHIHISSLHIGPQALLAEVRQTYWPLQGRHLANRTVHQCIKCSKMKPTLSSQLMGELPTGRVTPSKPFLNTGVDSCGPIHCKKTKHRRSPVAKTYISLFICLSTEAIHLELVTELTSQAFIAAFRRFISRRGQCINVCSDNGTNFVGADKELKELRSLFNTEVYQRDVTTHLASDGITWHFIPPRSPHFGGLWEAGVKMVKYHLRRVLGNAILNYEEPNTILTQIEACLNSCPLTPLSDNPNDLNPLTPGHLLIGQPFTSPPEPDLTPLPINRLSRWQYCQQLMQDFWRRWSAEYLPHLQRRSQWVSRGGDLKEGMLVLLKEDFRPPMHWPKGRIIALHPGKDGISRVATIKTAMGIGLRSHYRIVCFAHGGQSVKHYLFHSFFSELKVNLSRWAECWPFKLPPSWFAGETRRGAAGGSRRECVRATRREQS